MLSRFHHAQPFLSVPSRRSWPPRCSDTTRAPQSSAPPARSAGRPSRPAACSSSGRPRWPPPPARRCSVGSGSARCGLETLRRLAASATWPPRVGQTRRRTAGSRPWPGTACTRSSLLSWTQSHRARVSHQWVGVVGGGESAQSRRDEGVPRAPSVPSSPVAISQKGAWTQSRRESQNGDGGGR